MTSPRPQSQLGPVITSSLNSEFLTVKVYDERALEAQKLKPVPTVWGREDGLPIYERLPAISQAYRLDYFDEEESGLVYVSSDARSVRGPGTLEVGAWSGDQSILVIQSGTITWVKGQIDIDGLAVSLPELNEGTGLQDGVYQVGYYLSYSEDVPGGDQLYDVSGSELSGSLAIYTASSASYLYPFEAAFTDAEDGAWRPVEDGYAGSYDSGSYLVIDFTQAVTAKQFDLTATEGVNVTATCTLYHSSDGIIWEKDTEVKPLSGSWELIVSSQQPWRYWKLYFWDGIVDVTRVSYSGEAPFINVRPSGPISSASPFLEESDAELIGPSVVLAFIEVKRNKIVAVSDLRRITNRKYEPVAKWLTEFQDRSLKENVSKVINYSEQFLSPVTSLTPIYDELLTNYTFSLGSEVSSPAITFPDEIELIEYSLLYQASISPTRVIILSAPEESADLSTKAYLDLLFTISLDNGDY